MSNPLTNENPGALAGTTGAKDVVECVYNGGKYTRQQPSKATPDPYRLSQTITPNHKRMSRALGYALTLDSVEGWTGFALVAAARMTDHERCELAHWTLVATKPELAEAVAADALNAAGMPTAPWAGDMWDARHWAHNANRSERKAYALACFEAMDAKDQAAFFQHINTVEVAA